MHCEYDGQVLPVAPDGLPDACPTCEADIQAHLLKCLTCRLAPNLPDQPVTPLRGLIAPSFPD